MQQTLRTAFVGRWVRYFGQSVLPAGLWYSDEDRYGAQSHRARGHSCVLSLLRPVWEGRTVVMSADTIGCAGGKRYAGFDGTPRPELADFLSCGVPGKFEGLRLKKRADLVHTQTDYESATGRFLVGKRIDTIEADEEPEVVVFLARPDALSALYHLAAFATAEPDAVICPQGAGCAQILHHPRAQAHRAEPRAILGMFDLSARPFVDPAVLSLAVPWVRFEQMANDMDASFLDTPGWRKLRDR